ncbi:MAG: ABC transporter permease [Clostridiales bacterium]|nr:ABC transporter permease [Clostridiales bacterium]
MVKYIIKRVLYSIAILICVSMILYCLMRLLPSDYIENTFGDKLTNGAITQEQLDALKASYGLNSSIPAGYWDWLTSALSGDLGLSFVYEKPVSEVIFDHMWISFGVAIFAYLFQFLIAIPLGIKAATKQYGAVDYTTSIFAMIGISLPSFFLAILLIRIFSVQFGWFPIGGMFDTTVDWTGNETGKFLNEIYHLILPMIAIIIGSIGGLMRHTRTNTLEVLNQDYIRTARAKGLSEHKVVYKHVFRNTMVPIVTMTAGIIPSLFGGMMILEQVFAIDGIGNVAYKALSTGDIPFVMGYNMFIAILTVIGTLLSDIAYMLVDPRIKISK